MDIAHRFMGSTSDPTAVLVQYRVRHEQFLPQSCIDLESALRILVAHGAGANPPASSDRVGDTCYDSLISIKDSVVKPLTSPSHSSLITTQRNPSMGLGSEVSSLSVNQYHTTSSAGVLSKRIVRSDSMAKVASLLPATFVDYKSPSPDDHSDDQLVRYPQWFRWCSEQVRSLVNNLCP